MGFIELYYVDGRCKFVFIGKETEPSYMGGFHFREGQKEAVDAIVKSFNDGIEVVLLSSAVGSGKSLVNLMSAGTGKGAFYLTPQVLLTDQLERDLAGKYSCFQFDAAVIKGRRNYPCLYGINIEGDADATCAGAACTQGRKDPERPEEDWKCPFDAECHYSRARRKALISDIVVSTVDYALDGIFSSPRWPEKRLLIIDEADNVVSDFLSFYSVEVTKDEFYGFDFEGFVSSIFQELETVEAIGRIDADKRNYDDLFSVSRKGLVSLKEAMEAYRSAIEAELNRINAHGHNDPELARRIATSRDRCLKTLAPLEKAGQTSWVMGCRRDKGRIVAVSWSPLSLKPFCDSIWGRFDRVLLSSATFVDPQRMLSDLGLDNRKWTMITIPDTFPARRAPVILADVVKLSSMHDFDASMQKVMRFIEDTCAFYGGLRTRGLVHCGNYLIQKYVLTHASTELRRRLVGHDRGRQRNLTVEKWKTGGAEDSVFLAVGMNRGIDLPYDECRYQVIVKGPFADLGDGFVSARKALFGKAEGQRWYVAEMLKEVIQAAGRGMRYADDACVTYVLDSVVCRAVRNPSYWRLLPEWFKTRISAGDAILLAERKNMLRKARDK